jgi:cytochrome c biogenesis protein
MSTSTTSKAISRRKIALTERPRWRLLGFDFSHPFTSLWHLFVSVRLAIILITSIAILSIIGTIIIQAPSEVTASPEDYSAWIAANAYQQYGNWASILDWLQVFTLFHSWYFKILITLLAINIFIGGMVARAPGIWQKFRHPPLKRADGFYLNSPVKVGVTYGETATVDTITRLTTFFKRSGYRVEQAPHSEDEVAYLYIHKYSWSTLSTFVFHTCLIGVMLCFVITGWRGFGPNSMAERILPEPIYTYFQSLAGFSYTQPLPNNTQGVVYPLGTSHNIYYRVNNFVADFDPVLLSPVDYYTDLEIYQDGKLVATKRIRVNDALTYQGVTFHQASFMMYTNIDIRDQQGNVIYSGAVPLLDHRTSTPDPNTGNVLQTNNAEAIPLPNLGETMNLIAALVGDTWIVGIKGFSSDQKELFSGAAAFGKSCLDQNLLPIEGGQFGCKLTNGWWMKVNEVQRGTVLLITKDSGSPLLWPILILLVFSLWITFGLPPRRIWLHVTRDQVQLAALKEHTFNMQRELENIARKLGNHPLRKQAVLTDTQGNKKKQKS